MAEKKSTRKAPRTIEEQIADLQAKKQALDERRAQALNARYGAFITQRDKARERLARIEENITALVEEAKELGIDLGEAETAVENTEDE